MVEQTNDLLNNNKIDFAKMGFEQKFDATRRKNSFEILFQKAKNYFDKLLKAWKDDARRMTTTKTYFCSNQFSSGKKQLKLSRKNKRGDCSNPVKIWPVWKTRHTILILLLSRISWQIR